MNQSSTSVGINLRNKGLRNSTGSLIRGCVKDATTKLSIGSIPSNYQTIIYHSHSTKAFGTSQKRFFQQTKTDLLKTDVPTEATISQSSPKKNVSHSTKGYGPLIAKKQRVWIQISQAPGPGRYECAKTAEPSMKRHKKRPIFTRQQKQNRQPEQSVKIQSPGPGQYYVFKQRNANNGWKSSFKSNVNRNAYLQKCDTNIPGPGYYDVKHQANFKSIIKQKSPQQNNSPSKTLQILEQSPSSINGVPGPGSYHPDIPTFKPLYERIKISGNFMLTKKDRFNNNEIDKYQLNEPELQTPNIYSYKLKSSFDDEKRLLKWPCFMSESKRMVFSGQKKLGPSFITPSLQNRKNFHFNIKDGWF